ncbi:MAG: hypothetical protein H6832_02225 [Planctomycetes bacterium]|nr:hypothetical protein [Planctomycetota bacterium]
MAGPELACLTSPESMTSIFRSTTASKIRARRRACVSRIVVQLDCTMVLNFEPSPDQLREILQSGYIQTDDTSKLIQRSKRDYGTRYGRSAWEKHVPLTERPWSDFTETCGATWATGRIAERVFVTCSADAYSRWATTNLLPA